MDKEKRILDEVEKTLHAMDNLEDLESNPFLYTRLKAEIESRNIEQAPAKAKSRIFLKPVFLLIVILFNLITTVYYFNSFGTKETQSNVSSSLTKIISQEYGFEKSYYVQKNQEW